ncbi:MAG: hypothetical protein DCC71_07875 [Proteobacteria bacterium]|nr:MAG: hypothetical protein DCC71_07875 [Pseudomonadota bacterium]
MKNARAHAARSYFARLRRVGTALARLAWMAERICRPNACPCEPAPGRAHCSPYCERHAGDASERCACGHPECRPAQAALYDPNGPGPLGPEDVETS